MDWQVRRSGPKGKIYACNNVDPFTLTNLQWKRRATRQNNITNNRQYPEQKCHRKTIQELALMRQTLPSLPPRERRSLPNETMSTHSKSLWCSARSCKTLHQAPLDRQKPARSARHDPQARISSQQLAHVGHETLDDPPTPPCSSDCAASMDTCHSKSNPSYVVAAGRVLAYSRCPNFCRFPTPSRVSSSLSGENYESKSSVVGFVSPSLAVKSRLGRGMWTSV